MIFYTIILLLVNYVFIYFNSRSLGYKGIFLITIINLFYSLNLLLWSIYNIWTYQIITEIKICLWVDLCNNVNIYIDIKENFLNNLLSFVVILGAISVSFFVCYEMYNDKEGHSFIIILGFFIVFMLVLVGSNNLILFYLGWEGISLVSYFLVSYWSERVRSIKATLKIFIISKVGDFFLITLISLIISMFGTVDFDHLSSIYLIFLYNKSYVNFFNFRTTEILGLFLLFSTCIKSAQYGFHIWLLEAMEAPLGASALMHSSTLVISGVILILKMSIILELSVYAQFLMYFMGVFSALMGSFNACFQFELKTILAYSTISNMGYIFILLSVGAYYEATIVILLHAFIKIYMFLIIGGIIYNSNNCQDVRWIGNFYKYSKFLWINYVIGGLCLVGLPYFSGYYYKNFLLNNLMNNILYLKGGEFFILISFFFTIFYVFRLGYTVFLTHKSGHKNVFKKKKFSLLYIMSFTILILFVYLFHYFWINLLYLNLNFLIDSKFFFFLKRFTLFFYELTYLSAYLWIQIYISIIIVFYIICFLNLNKSWMYVNSVYHLQCFFFNFFLFFLVKCTILV